MTLYCGIDLHSTNQVVVVIDERDKRLVERRLPNDLCATLEVLEPFRAELEAVAVESTYNWYWLVDGLMDHAYEARLVNTAAVKQYEGLKYSDDRHDAFWLAHLMRLGILPCGHIYPKAMRSVRDLLRKRLGLVRERSRNMISIQNIVARETGARLKSRQVRKALDLLSFDNEHVRAAVAASLHVVACLDDTIAALEAQVLAALAPDPRFKWLRTMVGVGDVLAPTIALETGDIRRFSRVGHYSSYCRCVDSKRLSNAKVKGQGNRKCGNRYLAWAFSEAAHFAVRYDENARRFFDRKAAQRNKMVAIRAVAHKLARAAYFMMRDGVAYDSARLFG
jgi:transposase